MRVDVYLRMSVRERERERVSCAGGPFKSLDETLGIRKLTYCWRSRSDLFATALNDVTI